MPSWSPRRRWPRGSREPRRRSPRHGIPYVVPARDDLPERLDAVLTVVHLLSTTGHTAPSGDALVRVDLADRALDLARMLHALLHPSPRSAACWRCCSSTTPAARRARTPPAAWRAWRTRTARPGTATLSRRPTGCSSRRSRPARPGASRCRPRSPRSTPRRRATRRPTGRRSSRSTTSCCASGPRRSSRSTAPSSWPWSTAPRPPLAEVDALERDGRLAGYRYLPATQGRPAAPPRPPRGGGRRPTAPPSRSPTTPPSARS